MLELDLALSGFAERILPTLPDTDLEAFDELLSFPDQTLQRWVLGQEVPDNPDVARVLALVRQRAAD